MQFYKLNNKKKVNMEKGGLLYAGEEEALDSIRRGEEPDPSLFKRVKIVHISDTHGKEMNFLNKGLIPDGDILVHSGDMMRRQPEEQHENILENFNNFFGLLPHKHKLFVAGNNEYCLKIPKNIPCKYPIDNSRKVQFTKEELKHYPKELTQKLLPNCIYLQDEVKTVEGIRFYGTPWTSSCNMAFSAQRSLRKEIYANIPSHKSKRAVDIIIAHMPCFGILDTASTSRIYTDQIDESTHRCLVCNQIHKNYAHWGCHLLKEVVVESAKPKVFLCGHVHDDNGFAIRDNILFVNSALDLIPYVNVVYYYVKISNENNGDIGDDDIDLIEVEETKEKKVKKEKKKSDKEKSKKVVQ